MEKDSSITSCFQVFEQLKHATINNTAGKSTQLTHTHNVVFFLCNLKVSSSQPANYFHSSMGQQHAFNLLIFPNQNKYHQYTFVYRHKMIFFRKFSKLTSYLCFDNMSMFIYVGSGLKLLLMPRILMHNTMMPSAGLTFRPPRLKRIIRSFYF